MFYELIFILFCVFKKFKQFKQIIRYINIKKNIELFIYFLINSSFRLVKISKIYAKIYI